jgi:hypothetical protein
MTAANRFRVMIVGITLTSLLSFSLPASANPVVAWGAGDNGQTTPPPGLTGVIAISQGHDHTVALKSNGTVVAWGYSPYGQTAVPAGLNGVIAISAGGYHNLALKRDGSVVGWGLNRFGTTTLPAGTGPVVAVAAGNSHSLALKPDGTVVAWGFNTSGQSSPPSGLDEVTGIAAGYAHSLALRRDGTVVGWGWNASPPPGLTGVVAISAGYHSLALRKDGTVVAWGGGHDFGQTNVPVGLNRVIAIAAGQNHSLALKDDGTLVAWGLAESATQPPAGMDPLVAITTSTYFSTALVDQNPVDETFESGLGSWEVSGNVTTKSSPPYLAIEGSAVAAFNSGDSAPNGRLVRTLATLPGYRYRIDMSVGNLAYNSRSQRLRVTVEDNGIVPSPTGSRAPYLKEEIEIKGAGGGSTTWLDRSFIFSPENAVTKLAFEDISADTKALDLVLDQIRIWELPPDRFTNGSFESGLEGWGVDGMTTVESDPSYRPTEGGHVLSFNSNNADPGGRLTQWVTVTPGQAYRLEFDAGALAFNTGSQRLGVNVWQFNGKYSSALLLVDDEIDLPGNGRGTTAWLTKSYQFTPMSGVVIVYFTDLSTSTSAIDAVLDNVRLTRVFPNSPLVNGSFEDGFNGWQLSTFYGGVSVESKAPYQATKGISVAAFNSRNDPAYGSITQTVDTVPGKAYTLVFDAGNLSYSSQAQRLIAHVDSADGYRVLYQLTHIPGSPTPGAINWQRNITCPFTAHTEKSTIRFIDASTSTLSNDLVIDQVRLLP